MNTNSRKLKIYHPTADRERARANREAFKGFLLDYMRERLTVSPKAGRYHFNCPFCASGTGGNSTGGLTYYANTQRYYCFSCKTNGDIYDLMQYMEPELDKAPDTIGAYLLAERLYKGKTPAQAEPPAPPEGQAGTDQEPTNKPKQETAWDREFAIEQSCPAWYSKESRQYLSGRGFTEQTVNTAKLAHDTSDSKSVIIIPYAGDAEHFYNSRNIKLNTKIKYYKHGSQGRLYNQDALYTQGAGYVFITEGELDALSIIQAGGQAIATGSASNTDLLIKLLAEKATQKHLILSFDPDAGGQGALSKAAAGLTQQGTAFSAYHMGAEHVDANALLASEGGQERLKEQINKAIEHAQQPQTTPTQNTNTQDIHTTQIHHGGKNETATGAPDGGALDGLKYPTTGNPNIDSALDYYQNEFTKDIETHKNRRRLQTGIGSLDRVTDGGIIPGFYIVGAKPGLGKTSFMLQLGSEFARMGEDILFFSLELVKRELFSKCVSRESALSSNRNKGRSAQQIMDGDTSEGTQKGLKEFIKYADRIKFIDCNFGADLGYITKYIKQYIEITEVKPIVIIDYLQVIATKNNSSRGIRENTDLNLTTLKALQADNGLIVFLVSAFNRSNYGLTADYSSYKESGGIDATGATIWALEPALLTTEDYMNKGDSSKDIAKKRLMLEEEEKKPERDIKLKCIKNRFGPPYNCTMKFDAAFSLFKDT